MKKKQKAEPESRRKSSYKGNSRNNSKSGGLTFSEKKRLIQLKHILSGKSNEKEKPTTAQRTITFEKMFRDGICQVSHRYYTKMVEFFDINYSLLEVDEQADILAQYSKLINYFDPSVKFELVLFNRQVNEQMLTEQFDIPWQEDDFNDIREEYTEMLKKQAAKGNNGIIKSKYLIFGVESNGYKEAKSRLNNIEKDVIRNLNNIGTLARGLDGKERLRILHEYFNQDTMEPFRFSFKDLAESGKSVKDYIAPPGFDFRYPNRFKSGNMYGCVSYLDIIAPKFTDELIKHLLDIDANLTISMHMQTEDPVKAIKKLKAVISNIQKSITIYGSKLHLFGIIINTCNDNGITVLCRILGAFPSGINTKQHIGLVSCHLWCFLVYDYFFLFQFRLLNLIQPGRNLSIHIQPANKQQQYNDLKHKQYFFLFSWFSHDFFPLS